MIKASCKNLGKVLALVVAMSCVVSLGYAANTVYRAPGWGDLKYIPPKPGTYDLPPIMQAVDGVVLKTDYSESTLHELMENKLVLLSFIYARCSDQNGCPLANAVLYKVQSKLNQRPDLSQSVALLSVSFDPDFDTPAVTQYLSDAYTEGNVEWEFLTTSSQNELQPILDGYGQFAVRAFDENGLPTNDFLHLLKVFLIDRDLKVRNIYSVSFLHADLLINDLETLFLETSTH